MNAGDRFAVLIQLRTDQRAALERAAQANSMTLDQFATRCVESCVEAMKRMDAAHKMVAVGFGLVGLLGAALRSNFCGEALNEFDALWGRLVTAETVDQTEAVREDLKDFLANPPEPEPGQKVARLRLPDEFEKARGVLN